MTLVTMISTGVALLLMVVFLINLLFYRRLPRCSDATTCPQVSVLVPARNEAARIGTLLDSLLANQQVDCEILILDDESDDETAAIVERYAQRSDSSIRLIRGRPKPSDWIGKQYACWQLAAEARYEELVFLDADVTLAPDALRRIVDFRQASGAELVSGFPRQILQTRGEALLIPLIPIVLLELLPFPLMYWTRMRGASAGCGQLMATTQHAYEVVGGHSVLRDSLHDGVKLPRAYRTRGLRTLCFDASDLARCRMYCSFRETWLGLLKNAHEGFAQMPLLVVITGLMYFAMVHPFLAAGVAGFADGPDSQQFQWAITGAVAASVPRWICCIRWDRAWGSAVLFPFCVVLFLVLQWSAWWKRARGQSVSWRSRSYEVAAR